MDRVRQVDIKIDTKFFDRDEIAEFLAKIGTDRAELIVWKCDICNHLVTHNLEGKRCKARCRQHPDLYLAECWAKTGTCVGLCSEGAVFDRIPYSPILS